jgi:hypothetical protein
MLRVKVYDVDEHGEEKLFLDDEGNPVVKEGEGLVLAMQTTEDMEDGIAVESQVCILGKINKLAMGTLLNEDKNIREFTTKARLHEAINELMHEEEEETEEEETEE